MSLLAICQWLQDSTFGTSLREVGYIFPVVESTHVLALGLSVGTILFIDLRLLGVGLRQTPVSRVFRQLRPWMFAGFATMFLTGALLFIAHAADCYASWFFRVKVALLLAAGINALAFHFAIDPRRNEWDADEVPPFRARFAGGVSIVVWLSVIIAGRFLAYTL